MKENNEIYMEVHVKYENVIKQYNTDRRRSCSYGSWIYNYLCNQCLSPLSLWVRIPFRRVVLDTTLCDEVCGFLRFLPPIKLTAPRYNWNIVESGVKHHIPNSIIPTKPRILIHPYSISWRYKKSVVFITPHIISYLFQFVIYFDRHHDLVNHYWLSVSQLT